MEQQLMANQPMVSGLSVVSDGLRDIRISLEFLQIACDELHEIIDLGEYMPSLLGLLKGKAVDVDIAVDELATGMLLRAKAAMVSGELDG